MTYELAKQLKDAGFSQDTLEFYARTKGQTLFHYTWKGECNSEQLHEEIVAIPTLSELIEACPAEIVSANRNKDTMSANVEHLFRLGWSGEEWFANYEFYDSVAEDHHHVPIVEFGQTPEETVARLWLVLQRPKDAGT